MRGFGVASFLQGPVGFVKEISLLRGFFIDHRINDRRSPQRLPFKKRMPNGAGFPNLQGDNDLDGDAACWQTSSGAWMLRVAWGSALWSLANWDLQSWGFTAAWVIRLSIRNSDPGSCHGVANLCFSGRRRRPRPASFEPALYRPLLPQQIFATIGCSSLHCADLPEGHRPAMQN